MISIHAWNRTSNESQVLTPECLESRREELLRTDQVLWIDLANPTAAEEELVLKRFFPIHSLSYEDITRLRREPEAPPHFPKVEEFPNYLFVIVNPLTSAFLKHVEAKVTGPTEAKPFTQLSAVLTRNILITHHFEPLPCLDEVTGFLSRHESQVERGPDFLFHLILDATVDQYAPVLDHVDDRLDAMELAVMQKPSQKLFLKLLHLKRKIITVRKTLIHEREVLVRLARGDFAFVDERETVYYRNVYDHLARFAELIESSREMASDLMQSYLASVSNKLNEIMKVLTMISTVVLPMTLIAGVYGMNFEKMWPDKEWYLGFPFAVLLMAVSGIGSIAFFLWRKWL